MGTFDYHALVASLRRHGIHDERVLAAIEKTPRHLFMSEDLWDYASEDTALPIECEQTISQPYVVARMTEAVINNHPAPQHVLEIGTGSGYQSAVLAQLVKDVYTVERIQHLYTQAKQRFKTLSIQNVHCHFGDGYDGWTKHAPYDAILVTAGSAIVPEPLLKQLSVGGRMIIPVGTASEQSLLLITRTQEGYEEATLDAVIFVPLLPGTE